MASNRHLKYKLKIENEKSHLASSHAGLTLHPLLLFLCRIRIADMFGQPIPEQIRRYFRKISPSAPTRWVGHIHVFELHAVADHLPRWMSVNDMAIHTWIMGNTVC